MQVLDRVRHAPSQPFLVVLSDVTIINPEHEDADHHDAEHHQPDDRDVLLHPLGREHVLVLALLALLIQSLIDIISTGRVLQLLSRFFTSFC